MKICSYGEWLGSTWEDLWHFVGKLNQLRNGYYHTYDSQIPHSFQQIVSKETMLTLSHVLPAFEAMIKTWEEYSAHHTEVEDIIQEGLMKLESYQNHMDLTPAYSLEMRMWFFYITILSLIPSSCWSSYQTRLVLAEFTWPCQVGQTVIYWECKHWAERQVS